ncbi:unnamed protein product [Brugia timori]|uniref:Uncharacterized protein n=1 Tax=Brugia timori TaxID=42155 RepID=A0A0R3QJY0_9BILA|nr:unnamed protein product [Brugia timori]
MSFILIISFSLSPSNDSRTKINFSFCCYVMNHKRH